MKRGKKKKAPKAQEDAVRSGLEDWRDNVLVESYWPGTTSLSGQTILGDDVIERLATCGERIESHHELRRHVRWAIGHDEETGKATMYGEQLLTQLSEIYSKLDRDVEIVQQQIIQSRAHPTVTSSNFYSTANTRQTRLRSSMRPVTDGMGNMDIGNSLRDGEGSQMEEGAQPTKDGRGSASRPQWR